jgi:hypothetical protein
MKKQEALQIETFPKEEEKERKEEEGKEEEGKEEEGKEQDSDKLKKQEKNDENLTSSNKNEEAIELFHPNINIHNITKYYGSKSKNGLITSIIIVFFLLLVIFFFFSKKKENSQLLPQESFKDLQHSVANLTNPKEASNISNITNTINANNNISISNTNQTMSNVIGINQLNQTNFTINNLTNVNIPKIGVGFYFPKLTDFMVTTGECFLKTGKYNILFLTDPSEKREMKYNKKIKRIEAYHKREIINETIKNETIDFLIVSDKLHINNIKWFKSLGVKLIAISHDIYERNKLTKDTTILKETDLFDVYIHSTIDEFNKYKDLNLNNNIIIPNMISLKSRENKRSNLAYQNIMMLSQLDEYKINEFILSMMTLVQKRVPKFTLNIFSPDRPIEESIGLINTLNLTNNIFFIPFQNISNYFKNTSLFLYGAENNNYKDILIRAKMYGIPCIMISDSLKRYYFQRGVLKSDINDNRRIIEEIVRIMHFRNYRSILGKEAKDSLDYINLDIERIWYKLFKILMKGKFEEKNFHELRAEIEDKLK